jgi:hypothetical protein
MAGYTRNDTGNNIADGNVINAADLDGEFDSIQTAFNETSGHTHDGTVGEGAPISVVGPAQDINVTITEVVPKTTNTMSLGTAALQFKDLYIDGTANIDSLVADTADINAGTIDNAVIGGATPEAATFTTLTATDAVSLDDAVTINESAADVDFRVEGVGKPNALFVQGSDGNVGVNTNSPTTTLDVNGTVKASVLNVAGSSSLDGAVVVNETGADVDFRVESDTNSHALFVQGSNGAVGIGTSSPLSQLEVSDTDGATGINVTAYRNLTAYGNSYVQFNGPRFDTADQDAVIGRGAITLLGNAADTSSSMWISAATASLAPATATEANMQGYNAGLNITSDGELGFWDSGTERFTITSAGDVGIGTSSPASTLDVNGTITATGLDMNGTADFGGNIGLSRAASTVLYRTDDTGVVDIRSATASLSGSNIALYAGSNASFPNYSIFGGDTMLFRPVDGSPEFMRFIDGTGAVFNETGADLDFRIESDTNTHAFFLQGSDGKIGIGTSSPATTLDVNGGITGTSLDMNGNADFSGNINLSQTSGTTIKRTDNTGVLSIQGGTDALSTSLVMYGNAHATLPNWTILEADTMVLRSVDNTDFLRFINGTGTIFNETGADLDFRIESDTNTHAFLLRGDNGNVGIGTSNPSQLLEIRGAAARIRITDADTAGTTGIEFVDSGGVVDAEIEVGNSTQYFAVKTGGAEAMRIISTGSVGIGTSSPSATLEVDAGSATGTHLQITTTGAGHNFDMTDGSATNRVRNAGGVLILSADQDDEAASSRIGFLVDGAEKMRIDASGYAIIPGGVTLGTAAGTYNAANTLDDYEEGTWTPEFTPATGAFGSITYAFNTGTYTKVGRLVTVTGRIQVSGTPPTIGTAGGNCHLSGFPFVIASGQNFYGAVSFTYITAWSNSFAPNSAYISQGASLAVIMKRPVPDNNELIFTPADFISGGANSGFMFTATYFTT